MRKSRWNVSMRLFQALLRIYPKSFREEYGHEMTVTFREMLREVQGGGIAAFASLWIHTILDMVCSATRERRDEMKGRGFWLIGAAALGMALGWVDSRPHWDDTGITVGVILLSCAVFGAISPKQAWQWAIAIGLWVPLFNVLLAHNGGAFLAFVPAFLGAYLGAWLRLLISPPPARA